MLGFNELLTRLKHQQYQNTQHERRLDVRLFLDKYNSLKANEMIKWTRKTTKIF